MKCGGHHPEMGICRQLINHSDKPERRLIFQTKLKTMKTQKQRIFEALMSGETVTSLWGLHQFPAIIRVTNRCGELRKKGIPVQKQMVYPEKGANYMAFWIDNSSIRYVLENKSQFKEFFTEK